MYPSSVFVIIIISSLILLSLPLLSHQQFDFRPQLHYSVERNWLNDPNGLVWVAGEYHLYYQYHPGSSLPGPKSWGHAVSTDLMKWTNLPVAIEPDSLGDIWSGSAVVDFTNSSGLQNSPDKPLIVAVYTSAGESQQQSIAYSNDFGRTFEKFLGNPVIPNPGRPDFRDPKVIRYEDSWILVMAAGDRVQFYNSTDLKSWDFLSDFGAEPDQGLKGVWECPDFFQLYYGNESVWVLLVSNGGGGPNDGSNTQYFIGQFDGREFTSAQMDPLWMDSGIDNYASISFFNERYGRRVIIGWMTNLMYANELPTGNWRGQMTLPRELLIDVNADGGMRLKTRVVKELDTLINSEEEFTVGETGIEIEAGGVLNLTDLIPWRNPLMKLDLEVDVEGLCEGCSLSVCLMNSLSQEVCTGFDQGRDRPIFLDRERSGLTTFNPNFSRRMSALRETMGNSDPCVIRMEAILDVVAMEIFFDGGMTAMTTLYYPDEPYTIIQVRHHALGNPESQLVIRGGAIRGLKSTRD